MDSSKYKITSKVTWVDNLGRWVATYKSDVYPIEQGFLVPDGCVYQRSEPLDMSTSTHEILELNFWFLCFQYEQQLKANVPVNVAGGEPNASA